MNESDELCLCFHVTRRKVQNYLRLENPRAASQLSQCYGAGTGCGWCRPFLKKLFEAHRQGEPGEVPLPDASNYADARSQYVESGKGKPPPGATPT